MNINLLPPKELTEINLEKSRKRIFLAFCFLLIVLAFLAVILAGLNVFLAQKGTVIRDNGLKAQQLMGNSALQSSKDFIFNTNQELAQINDVEQNKVSPGLFLQKLSALVAPPIVLDSVSFRKDQSQVNGKDVFFATITLAGVAATRDELYSFGQSLSVEKSFSDIHFSPSSWTKPTRASFYLEMKFQPQ